jgi:TP901 family phage tail tape measure protein
MPNLAPLQVLLTANIKKFQRGMRTANKIVGRVQKRFVQLGAVGASAFAAFSVKAVQSFAAFEAQLRNVNTIAKQTEGQLKTTGTEVLKLSSELGASANDLASALYDINSASFSGREGLDILAKATVAGKAGLSSTKTAASAITAVLNAYGKSASEAGDVSDVLFKTVEKGVTTFEELSQNTGSVIATASAAGVKFKEVGAALATITKGGIQTAEATTALNKLILAFLKPTEELNKKFKELGFESATTAIKQKGLSGVMQILSRETGGAADKLANLGFGVRDIKAALSLTRQEGKAFSDDLKAMGERAGSTQAAFDEQSKSLTFNFKKIVENLKIVTITIGNIIVKLFGLNDVSKSVADNFEAFTTHFVTQVDAWVATIKLFALEFEFLFRKIFKVGKNVFENISEVVKTAGTNILNVGKWVGDNFVKFFTNILKLNYAFAKEVGKLWAEVGKLILNALSGKGVDFTNLLAQTGKEIEKVLAKEGLTALEIKAPDLKGLTTGIKEIEKQRQKAQQEIEKSAVANINQIQGVFKKIEPEKVENGLKDVVREIKNIPIQSKFAGALEEGTASAYRGEISGSQDKVEENTKATADNTKKIAQASRENTIMTRKLANALGTF